MPNRSWRSTRFPATGPGAAAMGFGATISAARARWLACDGNLSRIVMAPEGQVLDHGRGKRIVPPGLRKAVEIRDRHCVFAGCEAPTHSCDVHHVREWLLHDGPTSLENSALLCERHSHVGPSRLPGAATTRRPLAHLAPRRHRDRYHRLSHLSRSAGPER